MIICEECGHTINVIRMYKCKLYHQKLCMSCFMKEPKDVHVRHPIQETLRKQQQMAMLQKEESDDEEEEESEIDIIEPVTKLF